MSNLNIPFSSLKLGHDSIVFLAYDLNVKQMCVMHQKNSHCELISFGRATAQTPSNTISTTLLPSPSSMTTSCGKGRSLHQQTRPLNHRAQTHPSKAYTCLLRIIHEAFDVDSLLTDITTSKTLEDYDDNEDIFQP
ncbi:hypothetical protein JHK86_005246 [Glycine max]|nr:hypothetical protein JHK86_005246 [Glycine max]